MMEEHVGIRNLDIYKGLRPRTLDLDIYNETLREAGFLE